MEDRLAVISCIISNPDSVATVNEKFHLQSSLIIARLGVPCRDYGVSVISVVLHGTQNRGPGKGGRCKGKINSGAGQQVKEREQPMEHLEWLLSLAANTAIIIFEFIGVGIIIYSGLTSFLKFLRRSPDTKIYLAKGLAMGLEFKMGSEILRTVVVREWKEIGIVAGIIALRSALTFLIHWEIKEEERAE